MDTVLFIRRYLIGCKVYSIKRYVRWFAVILCIRQHTDSILNWKIASITDFLHCRRGQHYKKSALSLLYLSALTKEQMKSLHRRVFTFMLMYIKIQSGRTVQIGVDNAL
jgi:hypothetical protein